MTEPDKNVWDFCTNTAVRRASRRLGQLYDDVVAPTGLRATQHTLLAQIGLSGEPTLRQLAEAMVMDLSALGHTLKPLIRDGLVELVPDPKDRRAKRARLTTLGVERRAEGQVLWRDAQGRLDALFGAERSAALREALALLSSEDFARRFVGKD